MTYAELQAQIANYVHRTDLGTDIPFFISLAQSRLGRDLRIRENEKAATLVMTTNPLILPTDYGEASHVQAKVAKGLRSLEKVSKGRLSRYQDARTVSQGSGPLAYAIYGNSLELRPTPSPTQEIELTYWFRPPVFTADSSTDAILQRYPQLYLYGAMVEAFFFTQDGAAREAALSTFNGELGIANDKARNESWGSGATQGA